MEVCDVRRVTPLPHCGFRTDRTVITSGASGPLSCSATLTSPVTRGLDHSQRHQSEAPHTTPSRHPVTLEPCRHEHHRGLPLNEDRGPSPYPSYDGRRPGPTQPAWDGGGSDVRDGVIKGPLNPTKQTYPTRIDPSEAIRAPFPPRRARVAIDNMCYLRSVGAHEDIAFSNRSITSVSSSESWAAEVYQMPRPVTQTP